MKDPPPSHRVFVFDLHSDLGLKAEQTPFAVFPGAVAAQVETGRGARNKN
jgi:hypothetical protein